MIRDEFRDLFRKLVDAFSPTNPEKKAEVYFEELKECEPGSLGIAIRRIVREDDRMPSIAKILAIYNSVRPQGMDRKTISELEIRQKWLATSTDVFIAKAFVFATASPLTFLKGFHQTSATLKKNSQEKYEALKASLREFIGADRFDMEMGK